MPKIILQDGTPFLLQTNEFGVGVMQEVDRFDPRYADAVRRLEWEEEMAASQSVRFTPPGFDGRIRR